MNRKSFTACCLLTGLWMAGAAAHHTARVSSTHNPHSRSDPLCMEFLPLNAIHAIPNPPDYTSRDYVSPDGRYVAQVYTGEAESAHLAIYRYEAGERGNYTRHPLLRIDDVKGFVWRPHLKHTLVVAATGIYGTPLLGYWTGSGRIHPLGPGRRSDIMIFTLCAISRDGRTIYYHEERDPPAGSDAELEKQRQLRLP